MADTTLPAPTDPLADRKNVNVHLTPQFRADLAILMRNGDRASDAIRTAVAHMADAYRRAWEYGDVHENNDPLITHTAYAGEQRPAQQPTTRPRG